MLLPLCNHLTRNTFSGVETLRGLSQQNSKSQKEPPPAGVHFGLESNRKHKKSKQRWSWEENAFTCLFLVFRYECLTGDITNLYKLFTLWTHSYSPPLVSNVPCCRLTNLSVKRGPHSYNFIWPSRHRLDKLWTWTNYAFVPPLSLSCARTLSSLQGVHQNGFRFINVLLTSM